MSELKQKIYDVIKNLQLLNVATITEEGRPWVRYVMGKGDKNLVVRFCTRLDTRKVKHIRKNPDVHISGGVNDLETARHWLQIEGKAEISTDSAERHAFWFDELKNYFSGPDDPDYCVIRVSPSRIELGTMGSMTSEIWEAAPK